MKQRRLMMAAAVAVISTLSLAFGQGPGRRGGDPQQMLDRQMSVLKERLALTAEQEKKVRPILEESFKRMGEMREKFRPGEPGQGPSQEAMEEIGKVREETSSQLAKVLDEKQMKEYRKLDEERRGRFGPGGGRRPGGRQQ